MVEFDAFRYRLPLRCPLQFGRAQCTHREGVLIGSRQDAATWGDAAPLPGFSGESIGDLVPPSPGKKLPSLKFALDCLRPRSEVQADAVPVSGLLWGDSQSVLRRAETIGRSGYPAAKLKVGALPIRDQVELVRNVRSRLRADQRLRLDANRAWSLHEAIEFGLGLAGMEIEFIEEPTQRPEDLEHFFRKTGVPYALDETLGQRVDLKNFPHVSAVIIKPTLLGGREEIASLASLGIPLVFSACFESGVGVWNVARLAAEFSPKVAAGLDTYAWISQDVISEPLRMDDGYLSLASQPEVDRSRLVEINV